MMDEELKKAAEDFVWETMENDYDGPSELRRKMSHYAKIDDFYNGLEEFFIAGAKWQAERLLSGRPLPEDTVLFNKGVAEGKRLMMEEAVEGEVMLNPYPTICLDDCKDYDFKDGDKVRVIMCKKED